MLYHRGGEQVLLNVDNVRPFGINDQYTISNIYEDNDGNVVLKLIEIPGKEYHKDQIADELDIDYEEYE